MSKKANGKTKGHRVDDAVFHIPFYTPSFFEPSTEESESTTTTTPSTVRIPVKIAADGADNRANMTSFKMKHITHFDNNVKDVLTAIATLQERVVKPRAIKEEPDRIQTSIHLMHLICTGTAEQTLNEAKKFARQNTYDNYLIDVDEDDTDQTEQNLVDDEVEYYKFLDKKHGNKPKSHKTDKEYTLYLYRRYNQAFWHHLHSVIFGVDAYRAFEQQKDYMMMQLIKPFGVSVEAAFRRIDVILNLLPYFPPPFSKGKQATNDDWENFDDKKILPLAEKTKMKYRLLPKSFHARFDELETDWTEMKYSKFLSEAQKCEIKDQKERDQMTKARDNLKRKKKQEDDSVSTLSRSQKSSNYSGKRSKQSQRESPAGKARLCELCKMAGAPSFVYTTHNTTDCKKKEQYSKLLSGGAGQRKKATNEYRSHEKQLRREFKLLKRIEQLKSKNSHRSRKKSKGNDSDVDMSSVSSDENISY